MTDVLQVTFIQVKHPRHFSTRQSEHLKGQPKPSEVSLHVHPPKKINFKFVVNTKRTTVAEGLLYYKIPEDQRMNCYAPPFKPKLF